jgi:hypothetical protein
MRTNLDIAHQRLHNQRLAADQFAKPIDVVQWLGAVQAQDYAAAKWALGLRLQGMTDAEVERAFNEGAILRTHVMRPTWHFVTPADIRWLLMLTAPRVHAVNAYYYRTHELDDALFARSHAALREALQGGKQFTRSELISVLQQAGVSGNNLLRFGLILMHAELEGVLCSGARRGNQFTYALLDERAPQAREMGRDEALAELTRRYFTSHGPATQKDYMWWSGLSAAETKAGLDMVGQELAYEMIDGQIYWFSSSMSPVTGPSQDAYLLPNYDEYTVSYKDTRNAFDMPDAEQSDAEGSVLVHTILLDGRLVGTWKRAVKKDEALITANLFTSLNEAQRSAFTASVNRYAAFLGKSARVTCQEA